MHASKVNEARSQNAVLLWDEADAMFYDRDTAFRNWEVRDVNVLLQELERFQGVCVLATNRKITLDKALERRIMLKVEFERPDRIMRRRIWECLLPKKLPVARDVDLDELSGTDLSGGEIKNVILNAARAALERRARGPVERQDFLRAMEMETNGRWNLENQRPIGFARTV
jgi:SpoVK/Ycf46/Vps4 family AAA+-type ATPase